KEAGTRYSFLAIDLPFHGQTKWEDGTDFTAADLQQIVLHILEETGLFIQDPGIKLAVIGFSLGGRMALELYQRWPDKVYPLVLLAPDGLKVNFWYRLATMTAPGRALFAFTMKQPGWFFGLLKLMNRAGLVNASIFKFVNHYIGDGEARLRLYQRWTGLRKIKPRLPLIRRLVRQNRTPVRLLYGRYDRIIVPARGEKFGRNIQEYCTLKMIASGHQVLQARHAAEIIQALSH
ncbi:MAG: alpha/beta hydrolase, partial [Chitinophagaceae bacterium]